MADDSDVREREMCDESIVRDDALRVLTVGEAAFLGELWQLLAKQTTLYTMGESSSLPEYDAIRLLTSVCYVLGIDPDDPDPALMEALVVKGVQTSFNFGIEHIERLVAQTELLWKDVCLSLPLLESVALRDTLESLRGFCVRYQPRFFAHEIPVDIDYPLCFPVSESMQGVDYVITYLERLLVECRFLRQFDVETCRGVLRRIHPQYGELIVNLFEPVASSAIGCAISGCDVRSLQLDVQDYRRMVADLDGCSRCDVGQHFAIAAQRACDQVSLADDDVRTYVARLAEALVPRVVIALQRGGLEGVFPSR